MSKQRQAAEMEENVVDWSAVDVVGGCLKMGIQ